MRTLFLLLVALFLNQVEVVEAKTGPEVLLVPQWHVDAGKNTLDVAGSRAEFKQVKNQDAIYKKLKKMMLAGKLKGLFAEGCEGKIDQKFKAKYNGWDYQKLNQLLKKDPIQYDKVLSSVALKMEVQFKDQLETVCVEKKDLVNRHGLAFSNVIQGMAALQFSRRKGNFKKVKQDVLNRISKVETAQKKRDEFVSQAIAKYVKDKTGTFVLVMGGAHIPGIETRLKKKKIAVSKWTPPGYPKEDQLIPKLKKRVRGIKSR